MILVDALSAAYVSPSTLPAIANQGQGGFSGPLQNLFAYRGIEATLFSGVFPSEHGVWGEFRPAPMTRQRHSTCDPLARLMIQIGDLLPSDRLRLDVRWAVDRTLRRDKPAATGNLIPTSVMSRFETSLEIPISEAGSLNGQATLFDDLRHAGKTFQTVLYPTIRLDRDITGAVNQRLRCGNLPDFWYIKFSALDALGHRFGPDIRTLRPALRELNDQLEKLIGLLASAYSDDPLEVIVLSDHGMSRVDHSIDPGPLLSRISMVPSRDYLYFLDSTMIRFWSHSPTVLDQLHDAFSDLPGMEILDEDMRRGAYLPPDSGTGDMLVALDEGSVLFPDFFRRQHPPLGMHGYIQVGSEAGMPFLAAGPAFTSLLPRTATPTHADVHAAMQTCLGIAK